MSTVDLPVPRVRGLLPAPAAGCDCSTCPFNVDNPRAVEPICSGSSTSCEYCGCARAEDAAPGTSPCVGCAVRCGSRTDIQDWMADLGGRLGFDDLRVTGTFPDLPRFIPALDGTPVPTLDADLHWPAYAVGLRRLISPATHDVFPRWRGKTAEQVLQLAPGQKSILVGYGEDPLVEAYWTRRHSAGLAEAIAAAGFDLVLAPNTSLYANQPRAENLINLRRNLIMAAELAEAGVPAVPNIYWLRVEDLERYVDWIEDHAGTLPAIAINLQTFRTPLDWNQMAVPGLAYLAARLPADLPIVVTGSSHAERIALLNTFFGDRMHLVLQSALQAALHGEIRDADGRHAVHARVVDAFTANVRYYAGLVASGGQG